MTTRTYILTGFFLLASLTSCDNFGNRKNPLYGIIYRDKVEVPQFINYKYDGGSVMEDSENKDGRNKFGIAQLSNKTRHILIFEEFITETNNPKSNYKILDTLNIDNVKEKEYIAYCNCRQNNISDPEIIAIVLTDEGIDGEYYDKILRAWRADTKIGKIVSVKDLKGINCINNGYGL